MDPGQVSPPPATQSAAIQEARSQPGHVQILDAGSRESNDIAGRDNSPIRLSPASDGQPRHSHSHDNPYADLERVPLSPHARSRDGHLRVFHRRHTLTSNPGLPENPKSASEIDWIVPVEEKGNARRTVGERLQPTIDHAVAERDKYAKKALWTGYALNIAIGLQVFLGAMTTGLAAALTVGRQAQVSTAILGGFSTLVASYLARARGSGEPELSITRVKDLEQFLRECRAFQMDHAHEYGTPENGLSERLEGLRQRFEGLLGNANGERKLSPVGITAT